MADRFSGYTVPGVALATLDTDMFVLALIPEATPAGAVEERAPFGPLYLNELTLAHSSAGMRASRVGLALSSALAMGSPEDVFRERSCSLRRCRRCLFLRALAVGLGGVPERERERFRDFGGVAGEEE